MKLTMILHIEIFCKAIIPEGEDHTLLANRGIKDNRLLD